MREAVVYSVSFLLTAVVIGNAFHQKTQFYPAVVYLTKSSPSMAILACQSLVFVILLGKLVRKIFFGQLRAAEVEHLIEKAWYTVTETCLAFTVFREEFSPLFVAMFTMLLFFKCFHWLLEDRVDYMERSPILGCIFHTRIIALLSVLVCVDFFSIRHAITNTLIKGASSHMVFGFEYMILVVIVFSILMKYILHSIDSFNDNPWENKAVYVLYLDLIVNLFKCILYLAFVTAMTRVHTFPLFAIRPLYLSIRALKKAIKDVILSRRAIRNLNESYQAPTEEELREADVCIICRDPMTVQSCKRLPCTHIFHSTCLRNWFQRQQTCPTCRLEVLGPTVNTATQNQAPPPPQQPANNMPPNVFQQWQRMGLAAGLPQQFQQPGANLPQAPNGAQPVPETTAQNQTPPTQPGGGTPVDGSQNPPLANIQNMTGHPPPFMVPLAPPVMPHADLRTLTDEQLRQLESNERLMVEARVQWLRDIQVLLDAAVLQMNLYSQVMSAVPPVQNIAPAPSAPPEPSTLTPPTFTQPTNHTREPTQPPNQAREPTQLEKKTIPPPPYTASSQTTPSYSSGSQASGVSNISSGFQSGARPKIPIVKKPETRDDNSDQTESPEEIRRRRLARFLNTQPTEEQVD